MSEDYHNVGLGMVPCKKGCRCSDCTIDRLMTENRTLRKLVIDAEEILSNTGNDGLDARVWRQEAAIYFDD